MRSLSNESADARTAMLAVFFKRHAVEHYYAPDPTNISPKCRTNRRRRARPLPGAFLKDVALCRKGKNIFAVPSDPVRKPYKRQTIAVIPRATRPALAREGSSFPCRKSSKERASKEDPSLRLGTPQLSISRTAYRADFTDSETSEPETKAAKSRWSYDDHTSYIRDDTPSLIIDSGSDSGHSSTCVEADEPSPFRYDTSLPTIGTHWTDYYDDFVAAGRAKEMFDMYINAEACGEEIEVAMKLE